MKEKELQNIISLLLKGWKEKHPEDFKVPENLKFFEGFLPYCKNEYGKITDYERDKAIKLSIKMYPHKKGEELAMEIIAYLNRLEKNILQDKDDWETTETKEEKQ